MCHLHGCITIFSPASLGYWDSPSFPFIYFFIFFVHLGSKRFFISSYQEGKETWTLAEAVDYRGFPADKSTTGGWIRAVQILGLFLFSISNFSFTPNNLIASQPSKTNKPIAWAAMLSWTDLE